MQTTAEQNRLPPRSHASLPEEHARIGSDDAGRSSRTNGTDAAPSEHQKPSLRGASHVPTFTKGPKCLHKYYTGKNHSCIILLFNAIRNQAHPHRMRVPSGSQRTNRAMRWLGREERTSHKPSFRLRTRGIPTGHPNCTRIRIQPDGTTVAILPFAQPLAHWLSACVRAVKAYENLLRRAGLIRLHLQDVSKTIRCHEGICGPVLRAVGWAGLRREEQPRPGQVRGTAT